VSLKNLLGVGHILGANAEDIGEGPEQAHTDHVATGDQPAYAYTETLHTDILKALLRLY